MRWIMLRVLYESARYLANPPTLRILTANRDPACYGSKRAAAFPLLIISANILRAPIKKTLAALGVGSRVQGEHRTPSMHPLHPLSLHPSPRASRSHVDGRSKSTFLLARSWLR